MKTLLAQFKVFRVFKTNNKGGKREDVHGRQYSDVYKKFGHKIMVKEYLNGNSWLIV